MDIIILCNQNDAVAKAVYQQLADTNQEAYMITAEELVYAPLWKHELNAKGMATTEIKVANHITIHSGQVKAVWNRIRYFPMLHFISEADRHYAQTELFALYYSFLKSINAVLLDPVETYDFAMEENSWLYLKQQAINAGLPVLDYHFTSAPKWQLTKELIPIIQYKKPAAIYQKKAPHLLWQNQPVLLTEAATDVQKIWIAGKEIIGDVIPLSKTGLRKLGKNLQKSLLEVHCVKTAKGYKASTIIPFPEYIPQPVAHALAQLLIKKAGKAI